MELLVSLALEPWELMEDEVLHEEGVILLTFLLEKDLVETHSVF